jgi:hypothetical protein
VLFVERDRGIRDTGGRLSLTLAMAGNVVLREIGGLVSREQGGSATKLEVSGVAACIRYGVSYQREECQGKILHRSYKGPGWK